MSIMSNTIILTIMLEELMFSIEILLNSFEYQLYDVIIYSAGMYYLYTRPNTMPFYTRLKTHIYLQSMGSIFRAFDTFYLLNSAIKSMY